MSAIDIPGYKILRTLGFGGQATVYLAIQEGFDREVALKVMSPALAADPSFGERFIREAKIVAKLSHKSIVTVYDVGQSGSFYYLAMEFMQGGDLKSKIENDMDVSECLNAISTIAIALNFAHEKGYIHRDVKSENILFNDDNEPVLTDFGIAKASNSSTQMTQTGKLIGTPEYMSPEQCRGQKIDGRSDLYSLGIILFEMLTKSVPFVAEDSVGVCIQHVTKPIPQLPESSKNYQWILEKLLNKDPLERFQSGVELANAVNDFELTGHINVSTDDTAKTVITSITGELDDAKLSDFEEIHTEKRDIDSRSTTNQHSYRFMILVSLLFAVVGGYFSQDYWFESSYQWVSSNIFKQNSDEPVSAQIEDQIKKSNDSLAEQPSKRLSEQSLEKITPDVKSLLSDVDILVQKEPQEVENIKQALKIIATVNTLEPENKNAALVYQKIISDGLSIATTLATNNDFSKADEWIALVEYEEPEHTLLVATRQNIQNLKLAFDANEKKKQAAENEVNQLLSNAEDALSRNRLTGSGKNNATYLFKRVLVIEPENTQAIDGLKKVVDKLRKLVRRSITSNSFAKAKTYLTKLDSISNEPLAQKELRQSLVEAEKKHQIAVNARKRLAKIEEEKRQTEIVRQERLSDPITQMKLQSNLDTASSLEKQLKLVEPEGDNALQKYRKVLEIDDRNQKAIDGIKRIEQYIIQSLTNSITQSNREEALKWANQLEKYSPKHPQLAGFIEKIQMIAKPSSSETQLNTEQDSALEEIELEQKAIVSESTDIENK